MNKGKIHFQGKGDDTVGFLKNFIRGVQIFFQEFFFCTGQVIINFALSISTKCSVDVQKHDVLKDSRYQDSF